MRKIMFFVLAISVAFALLLGYELLSAIAGQQQDAGASCPPTPTPKLCPVCQGGSTGGAYAQGRTINLVLPAVDANGQGALANLTVESTPGSGKVFVRMDDNPVMNTETQSSLRTAISVARSLAGDGFSDKDIFYSISAPSNMVGGQSAGTAMTIATVALLRGENLDPGVVITGAILANGSIGPVGQILAKAVAIKAAGYSLFLVPVGEGTATRQVEKCQNEQQTIDGGAVVSQVCNTVTEIVNVSSVAGIPVVEVPDVAQAYALMKAG